MRSIRVSMALLVLAACAGGPDPATTLRVTAAPATATPAPTLPPPTRAPQAQPTAAPTALDTPDDHLRFSVIGDWGAGNEVQDDVAGALRTLNDEVGLHAFVTTGDNIYPDGHPRRFDRAWHRPYGWVGRARLNLVASLGNHDVQTEGGRPVMELLQIPAPFYERTLGPVRFIVLDGNRPNDPAQMDFLRAAVTKRSTPWTVAVMHQPIHTCGRYAGAIGARTAWERELAGNVDLVLAGHDHNYQRFPPMDGVTYVVTGGGGAGLYQLGACPDGTPPPAVSAAAHHFLSMEATMTSLRWQAVEPDGSVIDAWEMSLVGA